MAGGATKKTNETERLLGEILNKLSILVTKIDFHTSILKDMEKNSSDLRPIQEALNSEIRNLSNTIAVIPQTTRQIPVDELLSTPEWISNLNDANLEKEAFRKRKEISKLWSRNLNDRKQNFWNAYKCEKYAEVYSRWITMDSPIFPRKFLIKEIEAEPIEDTKLRWDLAIQQFQTEISIILNKQTRYTEKYNAIDAEMVAGIQKISTERIAEKLKEIWTRDIFKEEEKSRNLWHKKQEFLENYIKNYGKEQSFEDNRKPNKYKKRQQRSKLQTGQNTRRQPSGQKKITNRRRSSSTARKNTSTNISRRQSRSVSTKGERKSYAEVVRNASSQKRRTANPQSAGRGNYQQNRRPRNKSVNRSRINKNNVQNNRQNYVNYVKTNQRQNQEKRIHFLVSGQITPEREKNPEETSLKHA